jgi:hypothetical protein
MTMLGVNGGLIGKQRRPSLVSASGVWSLNEQASDQRETSWPGMNPISNLNPVLWYDFSDTATVTVASSQITAVVDKGSAARNLAKSTTGPSYVDGINGLKCVDWGSSPHANFLRNTSSSSFSLAEVYIVQDASYGASYPTNNGLLGAANSESTYRVYGGGTSLTIQGFNNSFANGSTTSASISLTTLNAPSLLRFTANTPLSVTTGFLVGNETVNFSLNRGWYGLIGEIVAFGSALSTQDRDRVQASLAGKWGITLV